MLNRLSKALGGKPPQAKLLRLAVALPVLAAASTLTVSAPLAESEADDFARAGQLAQISGDPEKPRRHFRVKNTLRLSNAEALRIYREMRDEIYRAYGGGTRETTPPFKNWNLYNTAPYRSATHGARYVNNYANEIASDYGRYEAAGVLPVGSLLAKDSFSVSKEGEVEIGPLFIMEKMPAGFNRLSGDWRYSMILPDGAFFGETKGRGAQKVEYCIGCHLAKENQDHLFFVPEEVRLP